MHHTYSLHQSYQKAFVQPTCYLPLIQEKVQLSEGTSFRIHLDADWLETDVIIVEFRLMYRPLPDSTSSGVESDPAPSEETPPPEALKQVHKVAVDKVQYCGVGQRNWSSKTKGTVVVLDMEKIQDITDMAHGVQKHMPVHPSCPPMKSGRSMFSWFGRSAGVQLCPFPIAIVVTVSVMNLLLPVAAAVKTPEVVAVKVLVVCLLFNVVELDD